MIFNQTTRKDLRDLFCNAVTKTFGDSTTFLDFLEDEKYSTTKYDCYLDYNGENYIINRETGEYINWYKLNHIGRSINISTLLPYKNIPIWIEDFLVEFKESEDNKWTIEETIDIIEKKLMCLNQDPEFCEINCRMECKDCPYNTKNSEYKIALTDVLIYLNNGVKK